MYGETKISNSNPVGIDRGYVEKQPEHYDIATKMAQEIVDRFEPVQQNEMVKHILTYVREQRMNQIASVKERLSFLDKTLGELST